MILPLALTHPVGMMGAIILTSCVPFQTWVTFRVWTILGANKKFKLVLAKDNQEVRLSFVGFLLPLAHRKGQPRMNLEDPTSQSSPPKMDAFRFPY